MMHGVTGAPTYRPAPGLRSTRGGRGARHLPGGQVPLLDTIETKSGSHDPCGFQRCPHTGQVIPGGSNGPGH